MDMYNLSNFINLCFLHTMGMYNICFHFSALYTSWTCTIFLHSSNFINSSLLYTHMDMYNLFNHLISFISALYTQWTCTIFLISLMSALYSSWASLLYTHHGHVQSFCFHLSLLYTHHGHVQSFFIHLISLIHLCFIHIWTCTISSII